MVVFILENLVFILIGLELPHLLQDTKANSLGTFLRYGAVVSLVVILVRIACVLPTAYVRRLLAERRSRRHGHRQNQGRSWKETVVLAWTGVRGADTVVIALALPHLTAAGTMLPGRNLTIFITFAVVFATLVLQGLTTGPLIRVLGLRGDKQPAREEAHARHVIASEGLRRLGELVKVKELPADIVHELRQRHERRRHRWAIQERRLGGEPIGLHDAEPADDGEGEAHRQNYRRLRAAMLDTEREAAVKLRDQGVIGADVLRRIERDLDFEAMLIGEFAPDDRDHGAADPSQPQ
jgi:CPA1 family monovalent cation:H+ antiporter